MIGFAVRHTLPDDLEAIAALNEAAFGGPDEARITRQLHTESDSLVSLVAEDAQGLAGHIEFFRILIDGLPLGVGLGPMCARPGVQRGGIGGGLIRSGLEDLEDLGETVVFVLGHDTYYPRFGFAADIAAAFTAPWSGPQFMALRLSPGGPVTGRLSYPGAFNR